MIHVLPAMHFVTASWGGLKLEMELSLLWIEILQALENPREPHIAYQLSKLVPSRLANKQSGIHSGKNIHKVKHRLCETERHR